MTNDLSGPPELGLTLRRRTKQVVFSAAVRLGLCSLMLNSAWRRQRLLILAYHGVSLDDEHRWHPDLYLEPGELHRRLRYLRQERCSVLALEEGVRRLYEGTLPERSVVLTFDDGAYDFYRVAFPMLREFSFPATVFLTTYYSDYNRPVFDTMHRYLLWKARGQTLVFPEALPRPIYLDSRGRAEAESGLWGYASRQRLSGRQKDELLSLLASRLHVDYESLCQRRILHLMNPQEVQEVAEAGISVQLHTHRHQAPASRALFLREIEDNRRRIEAATSVTARHFCYPSGVYSPEFLPWLSDSGIESAVTCEPGLAAQDSPALLLPRFVDTMATSMTEFAAWVSGLATLPRLLLSSS